MEDSVMEDLNNNAQSGMSQDTPVQSNATEAALPDSKNYVVNSKVVITDLGDELVLMEPASGKMFSLNSSGRVLWQRLPATPAELATALCEAFEVSREDALEDSQAWLSALVSSGLVDEQSS